MTDIEQHFRAVAAIDPAATALWYEERGYSWGELSAVAEGVGKALRAGGVEPGQAVSWVARNHPAMVAGALGLLMAGNCITPINPHVAQEKYASDLEKFNRPAILAAPQDWTEAAIAVARRIGAIALSLHIGDADPVRIVDGLDRAGPGPFGNNPPDTVLERISSGTTGDPKRFLVDRKTFMKALGYSNSSEPGAKPDEGPSLKRSGTLIFSTFAHSAGLWNTVTALYQGRPIILHDRFTVEGWHRSVKRFRPKLLSLMPAMISMVMEADIPPEDLSSLIALRTGSAPLPVETQRAFEAKYGVPILIDYGASEFMGGIASWSLADRRTFGDSKMGSVGRLRPDMQAKVTERGSETPLPPREKGILWLKTDRHGPDWVATTDLASIDEDGFLYLHGRADEAINRGGFKVLPEEVADVLRQHEGVREVAVLGIKDKRLGEVPIAIIEPFPGRPAPTPEELEAFGRARMPAYFVPTGYEYVDEMPRTNSLKISRPALRTMFAEKYAF
ncbi:class I adenylate-forming enzyme family protein [Sphingobium sp. Sx8-8]|uniref:class I adenylate-forming enzyme family protein n=1 Tax=Sphingobium sp. Sx8-8 TaxID=2933617 RepID=UPI001F587D2E|nr:class I adenylate-forming enzyme family protein [Sphingobium sp. Sx8-8]